MTTKLAAALAFACALTGCADVPSQAQFNAHDNNARCKNYGAQTSAYAACRTAIARTQSGATDYQPPVPTYVPQTYVAQPPPQLEIAPVYVPPAPAPLLPNYGEGIGPQPGYGNMLQQNMCEQHGTLC